MTLAAVLLMAAATMPTGLWENREDGFVLRMESCGEALCARVVGLRTGQAEAPPANACGHQLLRDLVWHEASRSWKGKMRPPDAGITVNATLTPLDRDSMRLQGKVLFVSRTLDLSSFSGRVGPNCRIISEN